jgi:hypothetical protein
MLFDDTRLVKYMRKTVIGDISQQLFHLEFVVHDLH